MCTTWKGELDEALQRRFDLMVEIRRQLHAHPEPSGQEHQTSLYLYQLLGNEGLDVRQGPEGRGVIADLGSVEPSDLIRRLALRADLDALRIQDQKSVPYRSQEAGLMHACGHDVHTAILAGTLLAIHELQSRGRLPWPLTLRGIFQPAEETSAGAQEMIGADVLEGVDSILALHVDPSRPVGRLAMREGLLTASCDNMAVSIRGRGGHAARPHEASDPITAAAQLINSLYLHIPRATDSQDAVVITIGRVVGGDNANVIPEEVSLEGTIRTLDGNVRRKTIEHIQRLAGGVALSTETHIDVHFGANAPSVLNDAALVHLLREAGAEVVGSDAIVEIARPSMGSEDFAFYLQHVPGAMFRLGCAPPGIANAPGLHTSVFDVDEQCLPVGSRVLARAALLWSDPSRQSPRPAAMRWANSPSTSS